MNFDKEVYKFKGEKALPTHAIEGLVEWITSVHPNPKVLEAGPGAGHVAKALIRKGVDYRGLETSLAMCEATNKLLGQNLVSYYSGARWPIEKAVDVILGVRVFHLMDASTLVAEADRLLDESGMLVMVDVKRPKESQRNFIKRELRDRLRDHGVATTAGKKKALDAHLKTQGWGFIEFTVGSWVESFTLRQMLESWLLKDGIMGAVVSEELKEKVIRLTEQTVLNEEWSLDEEQVETVHLHCKVYTKQQLLI